MARQSKKKLGKSKRENKAQIIIIGKQGTEQGPNYRKQGTEQDKQQQTIGTSFII